MTQGKHRAAHAYPDGQLPMPTHLAPRIRNNPGESLGYRLARPVILAPWRLNESQ